MTQARIAATDTRNNFDLVRLFAAAQVLVVHIVAVLPGMHSVPLIKALSLFPGVPIFFFISGFLICGSWQRRPDVAAYLAARVLRIFPALWVSGLFTAALLLLLYTTPVVDNLGTAAIWLLMQLSFLQSWNPPFLRGYGMGVANPVLWTIPVELGFYVVLPLLLLVGQRWGRPREALTLALLLSFAIFHVVTNLLDPNDPHMELARKVLTLSPASFTTWLWMFLLGALAQLEFDRIGRLVRGRFALFGAIALGVGLLSLVVDMPPWLHLPGNEIGLINACATSMACLSFAYSRTDLARRWLGGLDLSYGIYLFHMPIINALIALGVVGLPGAAIAIACTLLCAFLSWTLVERNALRHKAALTSMLSRGVGKKTGVVA